MRLKNIYIIISALLLFALVGCDNKESNNFPETVKIALRDSGNKLLLSNNDSTSLILPIIELQKNRYQLSFQNSLSIFPDSLVSIIGKSFKASNLPNTYIIEVINCRNKEVSYSYQIKGNREDNIIPCIGRNLPLGCYTIHVLFINNKYNLTTYTKYFLFLLAIITFIGFGLFYKKQKKDKSTEKKLNYLAIGNYKFYKDQNKLVKDDLVIKLTSKECELIQIFSKNQNQIVKRDLLIKEVWENNGVIVGRSLDAYISRIRKKFEDDHSVTIINIHGVGYKLETSKNI